MSAHIGAEFFPEIGRECLKNCCTPKNGSRGGDTFCPPRGGVEGGRGRGQTKFLQKKRGIFVIT